MTVTQFYALLERYLKRNDLADLYPDFILMAEARLNAVMRLLEQEVIYQFTPTMPLTPLPSDFLELRHIEAIGQSFPFEYVTPEQADRKRQGSRGGYRWYTIVDNQIEIIPHPNNESETVVEMYYYAALPPLTEVGANTTPILTKYPNLYLYATLAEAALYREAPAAAQAWLNSFDAYAKQLNDSAQQGRYSGNSIQMRAV